jgi:hypothetical protein
VAITAAIEDSFILRFDQDTYNGKSRRRSENDEGIEEPLEVGFKSKIVSIS